MRRLVVVGIGVSLLALGACGAGTPVFVPVDSPLKPWVAPEADAYTPDPPPPPAPAAKESAKEAAKEPAKEASASAEPAKKPAATVKPKKNSKNP